MKKEQRKATALSRRKFIAAAGAVAAGGVLAAGAIPRLAEAKQADPGPLPWPWVKLDPQEAGERAFRNYHAKGG